MSRSTLMHALTIACAFALALSAPALAATITGTVTYEGQVPNLRPIAMDADPACAAKHKKPQPNEVLVLGQGDTMANVIVRVTGGLPAGKTYPPPKKPVVMDQNGCIYKPHVFVIQAGQTFKVLNEDGVLHNVHALPNVNPQFNMAMPPNRKEAEHVFEKPEGEFKIKCDVHPWMTAYTMVVDNPFFAVTQQDGKYTISNLPAGTYEITAVHEKLGKKTEKVTVGENETKTVDFKFSPPSGAK
jgi:plastocyanin